MTRLQSSPALKTSVINEVLSGGQVKQVCLQHQISRTLFYRWFNEFKAKNDLKKSQAIKKRTAKNIISKAKERLILQSVIKHPEISLRSLAETHKVTYMSLWRILKKHKLNTQKLRFAYVMQYGKSLKRDIPYKERLILLKRFKAGESVSSLCREAHISRTIFYRWLKASKQPPEHKALQSKRPRGEKHWRKQRLVQLKSTEAVRVIFHLASQHPRYSLEKLYYSFVAQTHVALSKSAFYATLRQFDLNTASLRQHYVGERGQISRIRSQLLALEHPNLTVPTHFSKQEKKQQQNLTLSDYIGLLTIGFVMVSSVAVGTVALQNRQSIVGQIENGYMRLLSLLSTQPEPSEQPIVLPSVTPTPVAQQQVKITSLVTRDDAWGALAINSKKSRYQPGELIEFVFGVVDPKGTTVCDADLELSIQVPSEEQTYKLSTKDGSIKRSLTCSPTNVTHKADYTAQFPAKLASEVYSLEFKATTRLGTHVIRDHVSIGQEQMSVVRTDFPTRIYPGSPYWLGFTVKAQEDFVGEIRESVPAKDFSIRQVSSGGEFRLITSSTGEERYELIWPVKLSKGQEYSFSYTMQFPPLSPNLYQLGPIQLRDQQGKEVYREARSWQIVADEYNLQYIKP